MGNSPPSSPQNSGQPAHSKCALITDKDISELRTLHVHIHVASPDLQKRAACLLANLAENESNQETIVKEGGLDLLVPLMKSSDSEVQRLAVHSLANLSVNAKNRAQIIKAEALPVLISMLSSPILEAQRQSAKTLANLAVETEHSEVNEKAALAKAGVIPPLLELASQNAQPGIQCEAVAAIGNLAVNDENEKMIVELGGLEVLKSPLSSPAAECQRQAARSVANLTVSLHTKLAAREAGLIPILEHLAKKGDPLTEKQALRALSNINAEV